jgi:hypothetical protein
LASGINFADIEVGINTSFKKLKIMRKTHSQDVALFFIIVDCFFLVPIIPLVAVSIPGLLFVALVAFASLFTRDFLFGLFFFAFISVMIAFLYFGIDLLLGYFKHYKDQLARKQVDGLWAKTIIYNSFFFFPAFYIKLQCWFTEKCVLAGHDNELRLLSEYPAISSFFTLWWFLAIFLAFSALASTAESAASNEPQS